MSAWRIGAAALLAGFLSAGFVSGGTWDVTDDWSDFTNPNGVWSYNAAVGDPLTNLVENYWGGDPPQPAWAFNPASVPGAHLPCFFRTAGSSTAWREDWPLGSVYIHANDPWNSPPEYREERANVAWTSPIEGEIVISGGIWETSPQLERDVDWEIWRNDLQLSAGTIRWDDPFSSDSMMLWTFGSGGEEAMTLMVGVGDNVRLEILWNTGSAYATFVGVDFHIEGTETGVTASQGLPAAIVLEQNRPNPFNPATTIRYGLSSPSDVRLSIYDIAGRLVRTLRQGEEEAAGFQEVLWNGRDNLGRPVDSGVYFYRLTTGDRSETKRMLLLR